jgi:hypothetical protein
VSILKAVPGGWQLRDVQKDILLKVEERFDQSDVFIIRAPVACHAKGQGILMYDGTIKKVENIQIGDLLMGPDSTSREVLKLHSGVDEMYRIHPYRGKSWDVNQHHILRLKCLIRKQKDNKRWTEVEYQNIAVKDYLTKAPNYKHNAFQFSTGVDFSSKELKLDPYLLGMWLGDGHTKTPGFTSMDPELVDYWTNWASINRMKIRKTSQKENKSSSYYMSGRANGLPNKLTLTLKEIGVWDNKHIPLEYLTADKNQRLQLFAGLMDTDGSVSRASRCFEITFKVKELAEGTLFLARSLGFAAQISPKIVNSTTYWRVTGSNPLDIKLPVKLIRKDIPKSKSDQRNTKFDVEHLGTGEYFGFTLDKDSLYLLDNFTVTHNSGKTLIAVTLARYMQQKNKWKSRILVPNNLLLGQYMGGFPNMTTLKKRDSYTCELYENQTTQYDCGTHTRLTGTSKKRGPYCKGCPYVSALRKAQVMPYVVINNYTYLAYKMYAEGLILDEGHLIQGMIKDMAAKKLWHHEYQFPNHIRTYGQLYRWTSEQLSRKPADRKLKELLAELTSNKVHYLVEKGEGLYRGEERKCLKLIPVDVRNQPPLLWPQGKVKKIFFLSGTINRKDVEDMGLGNRRICVIDAPSPIPVERRPLHLDLKFTLASSANGRDIPKLAAYLQELADSKPTKGFIHAPYSLAKELEKHLKGDRFLFHSSESKRNVFKEFQDSTDRVMVASGMYEGVDLAGDLARWQVICKVPWANLTEPAMKYLAEQDPEGYANEAARLVIQAYGRVCRGPDDFGETFIVDRSFERLYTNYPDLFPGWFKEVI